MTDLQELQQYYEHNLSDKTFRYSLANGTMILSILVYTFFSKASKLMLFLHDKYNIFFS